MKRSLYARMAADGLKKNRRFTLPYLLSCALCAAMGYVLLSLSMDPALTALRGGEAVRLTLRFGCVVMALFSAGLLIYTGSLVIRQRRKEFGLYNVLGMEKRHIGYMLWMESAYTWLLSLAAGVGGGALFSRAMLWGLSRLLGETLSFSLRMDWSAAAVTALWMLAVLLLILLGNLRAVYASRPVELLRGASVGEREPRSHLLLALVGVVCLGGGYAMAVSMTRPVEALSWFFLAVLLVIAGTYLLFTALSIVALKCLRARKSYYLRTEHFVTVSGMLHRMKRNAAGLASICILSTMVLVTVSTTLSLYADAQTQMNAQFPRDIQLVGYTEDERGELDRVEELALEQAAARGLEVSRLARFADVERYMALREGALAEEIGPDEDVLLVWATDRSGYESLTGNQVALSEGQALYYRKGDALAERQTLEGRDYTLARLRDFPYACRYATAGGADCVYLVLPDGALEGASVTLWFDLSGTEEQKLAFSKAFREQTWTVRDDGGSGYRVSHLISRAEDGREFLSFYGAFFFLGLFLGSMFLLATVLIIYYKQISEGFDDRRSFRTLRQVGMTDREIRRTIRTQVLLVFFLPLGAAACHICFAFPMIRGILTLFGMTDVGRMLLCQAGTLGAFALVYLAVYLLTARVYYGIVRAADPC